MSKGPGNWEKGHQGFMRTRDGIHAPTTVTAPQQNRRGADTTETPVNDMHSHFKNGQPNKLRTREDIFNTLKENTRADLRGWNLQGVDLSGADLTGADLRNTHLLRADFSKATLRRANLCDAVFLKDANLSGADLTDARLDDGLLRV